MYLHEVLLGLIDAGNIIEGDASVGLHLKFGLGLAKSQRVVAARATYTALGAPGQKEQPSHQQQWERQIACTYETPSRDARKIACLHRHMCSICYIYFNLTSDMIKSSTHPKGSRRQRRHPQCWSVQRSPRSSREIAAGAPGWCQAVAHERAAHGCPALGSLLPQLRWFHSRKGPPEQQTKC